MSVYISSFFFAHIRKLAKQQTKRDAHSYFTLHQFIIEYLLIAISSRWRVKHADEKSVRLNI